MRPSRARTPSWRSATRTGTTSPSTTDGYRRRVTVRGGCGLSSLADDARARSLPVPAPDTAKPAAHHVLWFAAGFAVRRCPPQSGGCRPGPPGAARAWDLQEVDADDV